jgi:hypothetical protein
MKVHVKCLGTGNRPVDGLSRWYYLYWCEAENGAVDLIEDEDFIDEGDYELPDSDWC